MIKHRVLLLTVVLVLLINLVSVQSDSFANVDQSLSSDPGGTWNPVFRDDFDGISLDEKVWQTYTNGGTVSVDAGNITLFAPSPASTFPYIHPKADLIPATGNFSIKLGIQYLSVGPCGTGLDLSTALIPNGTTGTTSATVVAGVWQDWNGFYLFNPSGTGYRLPAPELTYHAFEIRWLDNSIEYLVDDQLVSSVIKDPNQARSTTFWFGNPLIPGGLCDWTQFAIDYIEIDTLTSGCLPAPAGLISWWPGEGGGNDIISSNDGLQQGGLVYSQGLVGQAFNLNGIDSGVTVANADSLNFGAETGFTLDAWIKPNPDTYNKRYVIIDKRYAPTMNSAVGYVLYLEAGRLSFQLADSPLAPGNFTNYESAGPDLRDGQWHHVAAVVDRSTPDGSRLYVDGQVIATFNALLEPGDLTNDNPLRIGIHATAGIDNYFSGLIDEVHLFKQALTEADIQGVYIAGSTGLCSGGRPLPPEILSAEDQLYQAAKNALSHVDNTYVTMADDTSREITLNAFTLSVSKALDIIADENRIAQLDDRALYAYTKELGKDWITEAYQDHDILDIARRNLKTREGSPFADLIEKRHQDFIQRRVQLNPTINLDLLTSDLKSKSAVVIQIPQPIIDYKLKTFDRFETFEAGNILADRYILIGGGMMLLKGLFIPITGPVDIPGSLLMLSATQPITYINIASDVGQAMDLLVGYQSVVDLDTRITTIYLQEVQRILDGMETGQLPQEPVINTTFYYPIGRVELNSTGAFGAYVENPGQVAVNARLSVYITDSAGEVRGPYKQEIIGLQPGQKTDLAVEVPFTGWLGTAGMGLFGTMGTYTARIAVEYGAIDFHEHLVPYTYQFDVVKAKLGLFKLMTYGSPLSVELLATNNDTTPQTVRVMDVIPAEVAEEIASVQFLTPPTRIDPINQTVSWDITLSPGESRAIVYHVLASDLDLAHNPITPPATLSSSTNTVSASIALVSSQKMDRLSEGALDQLKLLITALPDSAFSKEWTAPQQKTALSSKIMEIKTKIDAGVYADAENKLLSDIRSKMDGNAPDWIVTPDVRQKLLPLIDQIDGVIKLKLAHQLLPAQ